MENIKDLEDLIPIQLEEGVDIMIMPINKEEGFRDVASKIKDFDKSIASIKSLSKKLKEAIDDASPAEASIEFSLGFTAKANGITAVLVDAGMDASVKVKLTWKK